MLKMIKLQGWRTDWWSARARDGMKKGGGCGHKDRTVLYFDYSKGYTNLHM